MRLLTKAAFAALLLGTTAIAAPAFADDTGCPPGLHRAESEGGPTTTRSAAPTPRAVRTTTRSAGRSEGGQNNNPVRRADSEGGQNKMRSAAPTPRAVRTTIRSVARIPRAARTTTRSVVPTPRAVRTTTRCAMRIPRAAKTTTRCVALTPRVVRTTTRSAALRRSHPRARQRSRPASNRASRDNRCRITRCKVIGLLEPIASGIPAGVGISFEGRRAVGGARHVPPRPIDSETQRAPLLPWTSTARNGRCCSCAVCTARRTSSGEATGAPCTAVTTSPATMPRSRASQSASTKQPGRRSSSGRARTACARHRSAAPASRQGQASSGSWPRQLRLITPPPGMKFGHSATIAVNVCSLPSRQTVSFAG